MFEASAKSFTTTAPASKRVLIFNMLLSCIGINKLGYYKAASGDCERVWLQTRSAGMPFSPLAAQSGRISGIFRQAFDS
ncbi:hypothetical protein HMPREF9370_1338 [Neisseria wadsworthii 9715]|uniref:Uncharacterized protein n=1 Tax=Neisseria wadsworthii 9715 TaxID=1030841 RepID=G4CQH8_9NEIS|nr:hypothetical protein HMPREF9370_1338 [Neisseria wadsworthii 9715]